MSFTLEIKPKKSFEVERLTQAAKRKCRERILAVASDSDQANLAAAAGSNQMTTAEEVFYGEFVDWVRETRKTWPKLVETGSDINDDNNWPNLSQEATTFVREF